MVSTSFGPAYVRISGPKDAPALFLLHGAGGNSLHWVPNIAQLSKHFQTFALDTVGDNGLSVYHKRMLTPRDYADWLDQVVFGRNFLWSPACCALYQTTPQQGIGPGLTGPGRHGSTDFLSLDIQGSPLCSQQLLDYKKFSLLAFCGPG